MNKLILSIVCIMLVWLAIVALQIATCSITTKYSEPPRVQMTVREEREFRRLCKKHGIWWNVKDKGKQYFYRAGVKCQFK